MTPHVKELRDRVAYQISGLLEPNEFHQEVAQAIINAVVDDILVNVVGEDESVRMQKNLTPLGDRIERNHLRIEIRQQLNRYKENHE